MKHKGTVRLETDRLILADPPSVYARRRASHVPQLGIGQGSDPLSDLAHA